ncbi:30S ribosomal protein S13 [Candidatus Nitrosopumilus sediminis]|uniref:Small ribosomal subunit protein uS13 n=1 Tax=Candidatus Nitrosopumilus sediminis TaxID=1229909 RepID=K0BCM4_9ARCH|nr:30S ribosomal protein S13 [Candidatus Nitrosopumilus sediminis]AFS82126.1 30S ribosomal protein S13P [Candidatus Nitrosopumilus sediminis]
MSAQEYRHIVRIVGNDIRGEKKMVIGLTQIKGLGYNFATAILDTLKINPNSNIGNLTDENVQAIEKLITDPIASNFPSWFLNRRKDIETGADLHLLTSDIPFTLRNDIERERITASWRGYRHLSGLKVRGQRTRTSGRKGGAVGVAKGGMAAPVKKGGAGAPAAAAPSAEAPAEGAPAAAEAPAAEKKE